MSNNDDESLSVNEDRGRGRNFAERADSSDQVKKKLRSGWRNDDAVLEQYFSSCFANWKIYKGERTPHQVLKLLAIYRQATQGDNIEAPPLKLDTAEGMKWVTWNNLRGMPKIMAKRRFITYLSEINPILIDVMPDEKPPLGFPMDRKGLLICAKCNTTVGCSRPLLDQNKMNLKQQLFENEELHEPDKFKAWVQHVLENQRCVWGVHKAVSKVDAKPFAAWFDKPENRGFRSYDSITVMVLVRELVHYHHEVAYDMMRDSEVDPIDYNAQSVRATKLRKVYEQLVGDEFVFLTPCERDNDVCNLHRTADGGHNHTHRAEIAPPTAVDNSSMEEAVQLRIQCQRLGLSPCTGVVTDTAQRCDVYRARIAEHFDALQKAALAKTRNDKRGALHAKEKRKVKELSRQMLSKQCSDICQMNMVEAVLQIVHRGCNPNEESPRGMTPLITLVLNDAPVEKAEELMRLKVNANYVNRFGFTALSFACRTTNTKMLHVLLRGGASALQKDDKRGRTALHWCAIHGCEEMVKIIVEYLQEGVGDSMRVTRFLDAQGTDGESALMLAARHRNGLMCHLLTSIGANPNMRNAKGRTAAYIARSANWSELADWLEKKVGAGMAKLATFSDLQFEKSNRIGLVKVRELIHQFGRCYLMLLQGRVGLHPLGCPFTAKARVLERGERAVVEQRKVMDNHQLYVLKRDVAVFNSGHAQADPPDHKLVAEMRLHVRDMLALLRAGSTNPNAETEPKPLPWTPLMCAVALSDVRTVRLMMHEGARPNHPNRDGTTPVMLAAQLQNAAVLAELLLNKGDLEARDNQGYSVTSYATSLPLPSVMDRDVVGILMGGDTDGPKPITSMGLIKLALSGNLTELKTSLSAHEADASPEMLDAHFQRLFLLEKYGLTQVLTQRNIHDTVKTAQWRVKDPPVIVRARSPNSENKRNVLYHKRLLAAAAEKRAQEGQESGVLRCPVCTLAVPCAHFFKIEVLEQYLQRKSQIEAKQDAEQLALPPGKKKQYFSARKRLIMNRAAQILDEAHLGDRRTDRSTAFVNAYRPREMQVIREVEAARVAELAAEEEEEEALLREAEKIAEEEVEEDEMEYGEGYFLQGQEEQEEQEWEGPEGQEGYALPEGALLIADGSNAMGGAGGAEGQGSKVLTLAALERRGEGTKLAAAKRLPSRRELEEPRAGGVRAGGESSGEGTVVLAGLQETALVLVPSEEDALVPFQQKRRVKFYLPGADGLGDLLLDNGADTLAIEDGVGDSRSGYSGGDGYSGSGEAVLLLSDRPHEHDLSSLSVGSVTGIGSSDDSVNSGSDVFRSQLITKGILKKPKRWDQGGRGLGAQGRTGFSLGKSPGIAMVDMEGGLGPMGPMGGGGIGGLEGMEISYGLDPKFSSITLGTIDGASNAGDADFGDIQSVTTADSDSGGDSDNFVEGEDGGQAAHVQRVLVVSGAQGVQGEGKGGEVEGEDKIEGGGDESKGKAKARAGGMLASLQVASSASKASEPQNPVPVNDRRVSMYTKAGLARRGNTAGLVHVSTPNEPAPPEAGSAGEADERAALLRGGKMRKGVGKGGSGGTGGKAYKRKAKGPVEVLRVQVSGWIFVSLADLRSDLNPLDCVSLSLENWGAMLACVSEKFFEELLPQMQLHPVTSVRTWQSTAPRCAVCSVGFVRIKRSMQAFEENPLAYIETHKQHSSTADAHLCLACALRKELFSQSKRFFPPAFTDSASLPWPLMHRRNVVHKREATPQTPQLQIQAQHQEQLQLGPGSPNSPEMGSFLVPGQLEGGSLVSAITIGSVEVGDMLGSGIMGFMGGMGDGGSVGEGGMVTFDDLSHTLDLDLPALAQLSGPARQMAASSSPTKSHRLQELDAQEAWERAHNPHFTASMLEDDISTQGGESLLSALSGTARLPTLQSLDQGSLGTPMGTPLTVSLASTVSALKPNKKPKEMALIPFLVAKGHFEEAERTLRIALGKQAVDEGEGLKLLVNMLCLQAEMYKSMGAWPLALAVLFDCVDLNATLMGFDSSTLDLIGLLVSCLRKMQKVHMAGAYVKALCAYVEQETLKSIRFETVRQIKQRDEVQVGEFLALNAIWSERLKPAVVVKNPLQLRFQSVVGMGGFYSLLTAQDGFAVVARIAFYRFCHDVDAGTLGQLAGFVDFCFRLRFVEEMQVFRYMVQQAVQKQLAQSLVPTSELASLFRTLTKKEDLDSMKDFTSYSLLPSVQVFDALLAHCLQKLLPVYRIFLLFEPAGSILRERDVIAEAYDVSATIVQCKQRQRVAREVLRGKRVVAAEERAEREAIKAKEKKKKSRF